MYLYVDISTLLFGLKNACFACRHVYVCRYVHVFAFRRLAMVNVENNFPAYKLICLVCIDLHMNVHTYISYECIGISR